MLKDSNGDSNSHMNNPLFKLLSIFGFASSAIAGDIALKEGDCWSYATRPGEEASFLVIRKMETLPKVGGSFHLRLEDQESFRSKRLHRSGWPSSHCRSESPLILEKENSEEHP